MVCSKCGNRVQVRNKYCPECANPIQSNTKPDLSTTTDTNNFNFQDAEQTPRKRMNIVIRIVLCIIFFILMTLVHVIRKQMGITGIIPNLIEGVLIFGVIGYIWNR